jgi:hypothetical protein
MDKKCPKCGNIFDCKGIWGCWCITYPPLKKEQISEDEDCFCKKCLKEKYFEKLFPDE